ncbi:hypothetical protein [Streptomyces sp. bgisy082]|uniref:hypothetical protein n=1 Tax=Streptomyces sp. bgisy082 TaxID=3413776 RepID=UPI003D764766
MVQAREMLGSRELGRWRGALDDWAGEWRARGWPDETPDYLLHGWFPMLRAAGDPDAMAACALDAVRHDRLLAATGGDGAALGEITTAGEALLERGDRPGLVVDLLRLALRRAALRDRNGRVPVELPVAWAEVGEVDRGLALARGLEPVNRVLALCEVARFLYARGEKERALALLDEADVSARTIHDVTQRPSALRSMGDAWLAVGEADRAEAIVLELGEVLGSGLLLDVVAFRCQAGGFRHALDMLDEQGPLGKARTEAMGRAVVCVALAGAGRETEALDLARSAHGVGRALALVRIAAEVREGADTLVTEGLAALPPERPRRSEIAAALIEALVVAGAVESAELLAAEWSGGRYVPDRDLPLVRGLVRAGALDRAEALIDRIASRADRDGARTLLIEARARVGATERLESSLAELTVPSSRSCAVRLVIGALVRAGRVKEAEALVSYAAGTAVSRRVCLARALAGAGYRGRSVALLGRIETESRVPRGEEMAPVLAAVAEALALAGHGERARVLTDGLEAVTNRETEVLAVVRALLAAGRFEEAGREVRGAPDEQRDHLLDLLARASGDPALSEAPGRFRMLGEGRLIARGTEYLLLPAPEEGASVVETERRAARAHALREEGRDEEAAQELTRAVAAVRGILRYTAAPLPAVVRAQTALRRTAEAAELLHEAALYAKYSDRSREKSFLAEALVVTGRYEEAVVLARSPRSVSDDPTATQLDLVGILARAEQYARAEDLLDGLALRGLARARAYADLALAHPDPVRARELTALALHTGPWYEALPAVLRHEPEALPLVLAEADRLRRALEV